MNKKIQKSMIEKIGKVLFTLKETEDWLHIREISRRCEIHPQTVSNIVDKYLFNFVETQNFEEYGLKVKLIRIKDPKTTLEGIIKYWNVIRDLK